MEILPLSRPRSEFSQLCGRRLREGDQFLVGGVVEVVGAAVNHSLGDERASACEGDGVSLGQFCDNGPYLALQVGQHR